MVTKLQRKNTFSRRKPYTEERKAKQREYLVKARLARVNKPTNHIKCLTNREISNKLQEMGSGPTNTDETVMDSIDVLNGDLVETIDSINDLKLQLDENTHEEEISILSDDINDLKLEVAGLRGLLADLDERMEFTDNQLTTVIDLIY